MYIRHCGITGFKVDTGQVDAVLCDKCCFRDCEVECLDCVPCKFGWYYKETNKVKLFNFANENAVDLLLMKVPPLTQIEFRTTTKTWVGIRSHEKFAEAKSYTLARVACLRDVEKSAVEAIKTSERMKAKGLYSYTFRGVTVGIERTKREAKRIAVKNVRDYFDIMIEKEILDGNSK